ncbi:NAD(P)/FAD-dependent oxidoreductase [Candidatus Woesearchaeota archaeon]|nr:NAD(P)/FAD-dependent oxidoreductase [Candidatus Woesearchaeota archaeon]
MKPTKKSNLYDTIIIGSGLAGCTAAIYAARKRMNFLLLTDTFGGQFLESGNIYNYPGINKISGFDFSALMEKQLEYNTIKPLIGVPVTKLQKHGKNFQVITDKKKFTARSLIITTGARARELTIPGEQKYKNKGLTYCAICDGPLFKNKDVTVIGGGNSALEAADFLLNIAKSITILNLNPVFNAHEYLLEQISGHKKVKIINNAKTLEILGNTFVSGIKYKQKNQVKILKTQGIFVEIGRIPNTNFLKGFLKLDQHQHIIIDQTTQTSVPGVFAAGDCSSVHEYQYIIAAGQGCTALIKAARYLAQKK